MDYLEGLNPAQKQAVQTVDGYLRIIAGAGTGKTRVITHRICYLIEHVKVAPYRILALTFTNKAAKEMRERVSHLLGQTDNSVMICTFHALCVRILKEDIEHLHYPKSFVILDGDDQKSILKQIYKQLNIDSKMFPYPSILGYISNQKNQGSKPKDLITLNQEMGFDTIKPQIYDLYEKEKNKQHALDFDDLLLFVDHLFDQFAPILEKWQSRFQYVHVDEFQDTNDIQFSIVKKLIAKHQNLCVVGDGDQTIYTWRGANADLILNFDKIFSNVKTITLDTNYRSTKNILNVANQLIDHNQQRLKKTLRTDNVQGQTIEYKTFMSEEQEAAHVADRIRELCNYQDVSFRQCAILYRANYLSRPFEQALINKQISYRIFGGLKFFERKEVKDMLAYLRLSAFKDDLSFLRVINTPKRGIGDKTLNQIAIISKTHNISLFEALKQTEFSKALQIRISQFIDLIDQTSKLDSINDKLEYLFVHSGYKDMLKLDNDQQRIENVEELVQSIIAYQDNSGNYDLIDYLHEIALYTSGDEKESGDFVSLLTIHAAKGLEFDYVFLIGLNQQDFPSQRALEEDSQQIEEERRLAYVAFTRARKQLFLTGNSGYHYMNQSFRTPSIFIDEALPNENKPKSFERQKMPLFFKKSNVLEDRLVSTANVSWKIHDKLEHEKYGQGIIVAIDDDILDVAFNVDIGIKKILSTTKFIKRIEA